jgi:hypothetical protein
VTRINELLRNLDLGNSVAEFDADLENYFVETGTFRELINDRIDIIAGDKGTGKTAIYQILQKKYTTIPTLTNTEVIAAFNPTGNPVFQKLGEHDVLSEGEYIRMWKLYILSLTGNWLLGIWEGNFTPSMPYLEELLQGLEVRDKNETPQNLFTKVLSRIGRFFNWKSAEVEFSATDTGIPIVKPRIEFDPRPPAPQSTPSVAISSALKLLDTCLSEAEISAWVAVDRLDEAFQGFPQVEISRVTSIAANLFGYAGVPTHSSKTISPS